MKVTPYIPSVLNECRRILSYRLKPENYRSLIEMGMSSRNIMTPPEYSEHTDIVENIRTAMDKDERFYRLNVNGMFGLNEWYASELQTGFSWHRDQNKLKLRGQLRITRDAALEAKERQIYMKNKYADDELPHYNKILDGFIIEHHLKEYFKRIFRKQYRPPANENNYKMPCYDDWLLDIGGKLLHFDAKKFGHDDYGWVEQTRLRVQRFFVFGTILNDNIAIDGLADSSLLEKKGRDTGRHYKISQDELVPMRLFVTYLNHIIDPVLCDIVYNMSPLVTKILDVNIPKMEGEL